MFNVSPTGEVEPEPPYPSPNVKAKARRRPGRPLPTDRMKFEMQVNALKAFGTQSDYGKRAVGGEDIAPRLGLTPATAALNNAFYMDVGLIERESKGRYKPTEHVIDFAREHSFDAEKAGKRLASVLKQTWFYQEVAREPSTRDQLVRLLARAADTDKDREAQLSMLLDWLAYAGLTREENGVITALGHAPTDQSARNEPPGSEPESEGTTGDASSTADRDEVEGKTSPLAPSLLSFDVRFSLTAEDLAKLAPEQITALFSAVGGVVAAKAAGDA